MKQRTNEQTKKKRIANILIDGASLKRGICILRVAQNPSYILKYLNKYIQHSFAMRCDFYLKVMWLFILFTAQVLHLLNFECEAHWNLSLFWKTIYFELLWQEKNKQQNWCIDEQTYRGIGFIEYFAIFSLVDSIGYLLKINFFLSLDFFFIRIRRIALSFTWMNNNRKNKMTHDKREERKQNYVIRIQQISLIKLIR